MFLRNLLIICFGLAGICYAASELEAYNLVRSDANGFKIKVDKLGNNNGTIQYSVMRSMHLFCI